MLIDGETIVAVGPSLEAPTGTEVIDAGGAYVIPGGIDPHTHLEMPFMGTVTADDFESGTKAALSGGTTMVVDFCLPDPGQSMLAAYQEWRHKSEKAASDYGFHMAVTSWSKQIFDEMETVVKTYGINTFKHFMAYKGALMVNDDELYNSFARCAHLGAMPVVHAENGDVVAPDAGGADRARRHRPRGPRLFAAAGGRGRSHQPRHHDRGHDGHAGLHRAHQLPRGA
ncbi:hypothetical protein BRDID11002_61930 [Bradyrhizobium diazoefficiens]